MVSTGHNLEALSKLSSFGLESMGKKQTTNKLSDVAVELSPERFGESASMPLSGRIVFESNRIQSAGLAAPLALVTPTNIGSLPALDDWRAIAYEWREIAKFWRSQSSDQLSRFSAASPHAAAAADVPDLSKYETHFLVVADTQDTQLGPFDIRHNVSKVNDLTRLTKGTLTNGTTFNTLGSITNLVDGDCNGQMFTSEMEKLANRAATAKANGRIFRAIVHVSCHGSDDALSLNNQDSVSRQRCVSLASEVIRKGAIGVRFFSDSCAVGRATAAAAVEAAPAAEPQLSVSGISYLHGFTNLVTVNGSSPPPMGPSGTGEVSVYVTNWIRNGGLFTSNLYETLMFGSFTPSDAGFVQALIDGVADDFQTCFPNGLKFDGKTYSIQTPLGLAHAV